METTVIIAIAFLLGALVGVFALGFIHVAHDPAAAAVPEPAVPELRRRVEGLEPGTKVKAPTIAPPTFDEAQGTPQPLDPSTSSGTAEVVEPVETQGTATPQPADNINPAHYRQHPAGCQCISVIRHYQCNVAMAIKYLWRAGLKQEQGLTRQAKMIEDLEKALWYMNDCASYLRNNKFRTCSSTKLYEDFIATTGYNPTDIVKGFDAKIQPIISRLLCTGFIAGGNLKCVGNAEQNICEAIFLLGEYIEELENK